MKIDRRLLPVKAHFFFFMAASGPILPYLTVYGKELGISEVVMGTVTAVVPITFLLAKPLFGFVADYFHDKRKLIFVALIMSLAVFYLCLHFVPPVDIRLRNAKTEYDVSRSMFCDLAPSTEKRLDFRDEKLHEKAETRKSADFSDVSSTETKENLEIVCNATCEGEKCTVFGLRSFQKLCFWVPRYDDCNWVQVPLKCLDDCVRQTTETDDEPLFWSLEFYAFISLMTLSMISFNVSNSISDAICFDMLGEGGEKKYGYQRVWGTIGFGITALLGGAAMDFLSEETVKNYTPAFILVIIFTFADIICCLKLKLPDMPLSKNIIKDLSKVLRNLRVSIFLIFAMLVGILDGFVIYFMFWFLEDLANANDQMKYIKLLEGLTVAAETLGGEVIFFVLSGKILKKLGYGRTLTLCFFNYSLRLALISLIYDPWWILAVELFMQGPTYALCYTTIVGYANAITPPGTSATMQGIVAGMDDGFGYSLGSLIGGFLYKSVGGRMAFRIFSLAALICCVSHMVLYKLVLGKSYEERVDHYKAPKEAIEMIQGEFHQRT